VIVTAGQKILAVFAHPDDAELCCYGTLAKWMALGAEVHVLVVTRGGQTTSPAAAERVSETLKASQLADYLMISEDFPDGHLQCNTELVALTDRYLRELDPALVVTHYPQPVGEGHQDHLAVAQAVQNSVRRNQRVKWLLFAEPPTHPGDFRPNLFIDITPHLELKKKAVALHQSEKSKAYMLAEGVETRARWWAFQSYVEGYQGRAFEAFQLAKGVIG
jgi:LmbE family N-acetylglucosaminyl deacetylase